MATAIASNNGLQMTLRQNPVQTRIAEVEKRLQRDSPISRKLRMDGQTVSLNIRRMRQFTLGDPFRELSEIPLMHDLSLVLMAKYGLGHYGDSQGPEFARRAIASRYETIAGSRVLSANDIYIGTGVSDFIRLIPQVIRAVTQNGNYLLPCPFYPAECQLPSNNGCTPIFLDNRNFQPVFPKPSNALPCSFVFLLSASNPTGVILSQESAEAAFDFAARQSKLQKDPVIVVVDDIYHFSIPLLHQVGFFQLASSSGVPMIMLSGEDKIVATGLRSGHAAFHFPKHGGFKQNLFNELLNTDGAALGRGLHQYLVTTIFNLAVAGKLTDFVRNNMRLPIREVERTHVGSAAIDSFSGTYPAKRDLESILSGQMNNFFLTLSKWHDGLEKPLSESGKIHIFGQGSPKIPNYVFLKADGWQSGVQLGCALAEYGIAVSPGELFYPPNTLDGAYIRIAVTNEPEVEMMGSKPERVNFGKIIRGVIEQGPKNSD